MWVEAALDDELDERRVMAEVMTEARELEVLLKVDFA
jgi:hypothetical protein